MDVASTETELRALMLAGRNGDAVAYRSLLEKLSAQLRGYFKGQLNRMNRGAVEAEDLVQETLLALHTRSATYDSSQLFTPWVYAIARYKLIDYLRRTRTSSKDIAVNETEGLSGHDDHGQVESSLDLNRLLAELSPKTRKTIQLVKLDGLSVSEAATQCGVSESAVKVSVHRGLKALARLVSKETDREN
jgi:RNA polymerase sigma-70 factor (ECF subfamily)